MSSLQAGQTLLHYRILEKIGQGGMGEVYKAEDSKLGRAVAVKLLPPETAEDAKAKRRLLQEARAASALNHPNIVTIYSIEESEGLDFIVMELVEGETLKSLIERSPLEASRLLDLGSQVAEGLFAAHSAGLIHRDIKSSNILVTPRGQAKILDFGLVKVQLSDEQLSHEQTMSRLTGVGMIVGTVAYMSPEQTRGEPLDARTDIFSLGCVLYEAATGRLPFSGPSVLSVLHEIATTDPPAPSSVSQALPQGLDAILRRALAKSREKRYSSAAEFAEALRSLRFANRYQILREIGRGGMGVVYLARDPMLERDVAIKVITPDLLASEALERFKREARVVANMDHPAIVGVYDIGEHAGSLFFVMPFIPGTNLRSLIKEGSLSLGDVIDIGIQVAEAIEYSHSKGVVHRDIKPENIMIAREESAEGAMRVRVTDFGLAMASAQSHLTKTGTLVGTIAYLSPEQLAQDDLDGRSDIYSLGTVLYECLTGKPPHYGELQSVLYRIAHEIPQSPRALGADIPEDLEDIVMRCLEKDPALRPQRAKEVAEALIRRRSRLRDSERGQKLSMMARASVVVARPALSPMIGREKEFADLQRRLNAALQGECQFVVVGGEAGVGKSRFLDELESLAKAKKVRLLHSRFVEQDQAFPYQGFCEAIQEYLRLKITTASGPVDFSDLASDLVSLFPVLAEMAEFTGGQRFIVTGEVKKIQDRTYIFDLLARSFLRIGGAKPLIILLEDLQNADVSLEALQYVVRRLGPTPTFIAGTYRTTEVDKHHPLTRMLKSFAGDRRFAQILLEPFVPAEYREFLQTLIGSPEMEQSFVDKLYEATEGNPHFTKELVRSLIDSGRIVKTETGSWNLSGETALSTEALPSTIQDTVEKRIERLPQEWKEILTVASVLGKTFEFRDLELLAAGKENIEDIIDGLISAGFMEEERGSRGDQLAFSSGVVRDVLYAGVPRRRRRALHRKYAEELEKRNAGRLDRIYPLLVHHYSEGDVPEKVIQFGMELAIRSLDAFSAEDALRAGRTVLDFLHGEEGETTLLEGEVRSLLARAHRIGGNIDTALQELGSAIEVFERNRQPFQVLAAMVQAAETAWEGRKADETRRWVEKGLGLARANSDMENLTKLLSLGATVANLRGEYEKARQYLEEAERIKPVVPEKEEELVPRGGRLVVALPVPVSASHPVEVSIVEEHEVLGNVFETLLGTDAQGHLVPWLCEAWEVLEQGKSFLFQLRRDVRMQDGRALTAEEIKSSFERAIARGGERLPAAFSAIRGVSEYLKGAADHVEGIAVQAVDKLVIELEEPLPIYPALLTDPRASVVREASEEGSKPKLIGTGPFRLASFQTDSVVLERNEHYWKTAPPPLESIHFRCGVTSAGIASGLRSGEFDLASSLLPKDLEDILQDQHLQAGLVEAPRKNVYFIFFNVNSATGQVPEIRKALCGIVRTDDLVRATLGRFAQPAEGLLPPGILGHDPGRRRQPLAREKVIEMLRTSPGVLPSKLNGQAQQAGGDAGPTLLRLKAAVHPVLQDRFSPLTDALFKAWAEVGIEVFVQTPNMPSYLQAWDKNEGIDLLMGRWAPDYDDPDNFMYALFESRHGEFRKYYSSQEMDRWIEEARVESQPSVREKLYRKMESHLMETGILLPLFHEIDYRVVNPRLRKVALRSSGPYVNYAELGKTEIAAASLSRKTGGGIIQVPFAGELPNLDPALSGTLVQTEALSNVFECLTSQAEGAGIVPWLACEFRAEERGRRFRFRLRDDVRFHDGRQLTARDVRYSFERLLQNPQSTDPWMLSTLRGAEALLKGQRKELEGFRILSARDFTIDLEEPVSFFPALLCFVNVAIMPEGAKNLGGSWREGCVGTGPFRVVRFDPGRRLELEANPNYWRRGYPRSDGMTFTFGVPPQEILTGFRSGRFSLARDLFPPDVEALRHQPEFASGYRETPQLCTYFIVPNIHNGPLADEELRHQLVQALDIAALVRRGVGRLGIPAHGLIPPGLLGYESSPASITPHSSKEKPIQNCELTGAIHSVYDSTYSVLAEEMFRTLQEKGLRVKIEGRRWEQRPPVEERSNTHDFLLTRWFADYPDADNFVYILHSEKGIHGSSSGTPEVDRLIERGRIETNPERRHELYREIERIIAQRALLLPLFHEQTYRFVRPEVQDFEFILSGRPVPYEKLWLRR